MSWSIVLLAGLAQGCAAAPHKTAATPGHDRALPADEPLARLGVQVDLEPASDCEERFDLALYRDRAIALIEWDDETGRCPGRRATISYLSKKLSAAELLQRVRALALRVQQFPPPSP